MSATTPTIHLHTREPRAEVDVRSLLGRYSFRRRVWRACQQILIGMTILLVSLLLVGGVDYTWPIARSLRFALVALLTLSAAGLFVSIIVSLSRSQTLADMALDIERDFDRHENSLVTFAESIEHKNGLEARPYLLSRLEAQAGRKLVMINERPFTPRRRAARVFGLLALVLLFLLSLRVFAPIPFAREVRRILWLEHDGTSSQKQHLSYEANRGNNAVTIESIHVRVVPPAYTGLAVELADGDAPVRALAGSQVEVDLMESGGIDGATLSFAGATSQMRALGDGRYNGSFIVRTSGAFEARIISSSDDTPAPFVRAVEVYLDVQPDVHITEPARDLLLSAVPVGHVAVRWTARDDLGLADVVLKYIRSRGEGDAAQFVNGSLPLSGIDRASEREWRGSAAIDLMRLGLQAGDTLVYWIEARDRNPSANNTGRSASLAIAIAAPEPIKLNLGDLGANEIGRFLISERMIIIHTEKLHFERARLARDELQRRANGIASEQRDFKNSFNDYIRQEGAGEARHDANSVEPNSVEERVREAEDERTGVHMHGIPDPPAGSPSSVRDMIYAIRAMWDAEEALSLVDTAKALVYEREALTRLKRAQLAVRYVPPVFARSTPIDLKRRYAGELNEIKTRLEKLTRQPESKDSTSLRAALTDAYAALSELQATLDVPVAARASAVARARERTLQSANGLGGVGGDHAATIAEAMGQLRVVESELSRLEISGNADDYATRLTKSLSLLTKAAANLFAIAEARTRANGSDSNTILPGDDRRTSEYFRRLNK